MNSKDPSTLDLYFGDARSKLIDIAAFMDRVERNGETDDFRYKAFIEALGQIKESPRSIAVLNALSDPSSEPVPAAGAPAIGAWKKD